MVNQTAFVQRGHRFRAREFPATGAHTANRNGGVLAVDVRGHQIPSVVHFSHNPVTTPLDQCHDRHLRPLCRRSAKRQILKNVHVAVLSQPSHADPCFVAVWIGRDGRINGHHDPNEILGIRVNTTGFDHCARPQRPYDVFQDLRFDLLAPQPRSPVRIQHVTDEVWRQVRLVLITGTARHHSAWILHQVLNHLDRLRRGRDQTLQGSIWKPEAEHNLIPRFLRVFAGTQFIKPELPELWPTEAFRFVG